MASQPANPLAHLARPGSATGHPVLILHSWWGLTASFTEYADLLAERGFLAGCVDLYGGRLARTPAEAKELRSAPRREPMYRTMLAAKDHLLADPAAASSRVGIVGFSMGGHWAVWLAQRTDMPASAVVLHYATRAVKKSERPVPVLAHFAADDPFVTASGRRTMERSFHRFDWPYTAIDHPGTEHWFAESAEDQYDPDAAGRALDATTAFLEQAAWT